MSEQPQAAPPPDVEAAEEFARHVREHRLTQDQHTELEQLDGQLEGVVEQAEDDYLGDLAFNLYRQREELRARAATESQPVNDNTRLMYQLWMADADIELAANLIELGHPSFAELLLRQGMALRQELYG
jgi:hypothetical protein